MSDNAQQQNQGQRQVQVVKVFQAGWKKFSRRQKNWLMWWMFLLLLAALIPSFLLWSKTDKQEALLAENTQLKEELRGLKNLAAVQKQPSSIPEALSLAQVEGAVAKLCGPKEEPPKVAKATPAPAKKVVKKVAPPAPQNVAVVSQQPQAVQTVAAPVATQPAPKPEKWWVWHHPAATANSPAPCIFAVSPTTTLPPQCNAVKAVVPAVSGETGLAWSERVSGWGSARKTGTFQPLAEATIR